MIVAVKTVTQILIGERKYATFLQTLVFYNVMLYRQSAQFDPISAVVQCLVYEKQCGSFQMSANGLCRMFPSTKDSGSDRHPLMFPLLSIPRTLIPAWHPFQTGETMVFLRTWEWYPMLCAPITASSLTE